MTKTIIFGQHFDLNEMPHAELVEVCKRLKKEVNRLERQVEEAQRRLIDGGCIAEGGIDEAPRWFKHLCLAMDRQRATLIKVECAIAQRTAAPVAPSLAEIFMDLCAEKMAPDLYSRVIAMAQKRLLKAGAEKEPTP